MSLSGSRGLIRVSNNPRCQLLAFMAARQVKELDFYRQVTGHEFEGEYGERISARRRGQMFENNLHRDGALVLRQTIAPLFGYDPAVMTVRDFAAEAKAAGEKRPDARLRATREVFRALARGERVPEILIQPQLQLSAGREMLISPDFMVFDPRARIYVPGEEKSQILREGVGEPIDLEQARRQAAVQILALREEIERAGVAGEVSNRAVLIFASPFGLSPAPAAEEKSLDAEVYEMERALRALNGAADRSQEFPDLARMAGEFPFDEFEINYQESCLGSCVMAGVCKTRCAGRAQVLGAAAEDLLGPETDLDRVIELGRGAEPADEREAALVALWGQAFEVLGTEAAEELRRS